MTDPSPNDDLLERLRNPETRSEAFRELLSNAAPLLSGIRPRIGEELRARIPPSDVQQEVYLTLLKKLDEGTIDANVDDVHAWLMGAARNVVSNLVRKHRKAQRRDIHREQSLAQADSVDPLDQLIPASSPASQKRLYAAPVEPAGRPKSADEFEKPLWDQKTSEAFLNSFGDELLDLLEPHEREWVKLRFKGHSQQEIARRMDCSTRRLTRIADSVRNKLVTTTIITIHHSTDQRIATCVHSGTKVREIAQLLDSSPVKLRNARTGNILDQNDFVLTGYEPDDEFEAITD